MAPYQLKLHYHLRRGEPNPASGITIFDYHHKAVMNDFYENVIKCADSDWVKLNMNYVSLIYVEYQDYRHKPELGLATDKLNDNDAKTLHDNHFLIVGYCVIFPNGIYNEINMIESRYKRCKLASHLLREYDKKYKSSYNLRAAPVEIPEDSKSFWLHHFTNDQLYNYIDIDPYSYVNKYIDWTPKTDEEIRNIEQNLMWDDGVGKIMRLMKDYITYTTTDMIKMGLKPSDYHQWLYFDKQMYKWVRP